MDKPYAKYKEDKFRVFSVPMNHLKEKIDLGTPLGGKHLKEMRNRFYEENADAIKEANEEQERLRKARYSRLTARKLKRIGKYSKPL